MDYALLTVGPLFTVGVAEKERDTASVPVMVAAEFSQPHASRHSSSLIATPGMQPTHEMAPAIECARLMAATVEAICKMATTTMLRHVTAAIPESSHVIVDLHESGQITADLCEPSQVS